MSEVAVNKIPAINANEPEIKNKPKPIIPSNFVSQKSVKPNWIQQEEFKRARYSVTLPEGWKVGDVLKPEAWASVAHLFKRDARAGIPAKTGALISIDTEAGEWFATAYVRAVLPKGLIIEVLKPDKNGICHLGSDVKDSEDYPYFLKWNVGKKQYDVVRRVDKEVLNSFHTKEQAHQWMRDTLGVE